MTHSIDPPARTQGSLVAILFGVVAFFMLLGEWRPTAFLDVAGEPWAFVLSEAAAGRYRFGTDVIFTSGPLSDVQQRLFNPGTYVSSLAVIYAMAGLQALAFAVLVRRSRTVFFPIVLLLALCFTVLRDVLLLLTPLPFALIGLSRPTGRASVVLSIVGAAAAAVSTLVKFSIFPLSVGLVLLVDLNRLRLRAIPVATVSYVVAFYLFFLLLAPSGSNFPSYLSGSLQTSIGYTSAMAIHGPWIELALYGVLAIAALASVFAIERRRRVITGRFGWDAALPLLAVALFVWVTFKAGLVRHDTHALFAFSGLALGLCTYGISRASPRLHSWPASATLAAVIIVSGFYPHVRLAVDPLTQIPVPASLAESVTAAPTELQRSFHALAHPRAWLAERMALYEAARAERARTNPIGDLKGTVDTLPAIQDRLLARGLAYQPRPTVQEYTSYTRALIARNREFFAGATAPDFLVFETETNDNRHPAQVEGPLWPLFLSRYAPSYLAGESAVLHRRATPLGDVLLPGESGTGELGSPLPIRFGSDPLFLSVDVRPTLIGRIAEFLFKLPHVHVGVTLADGSELVYRLIPAIAREGFVASPLIRTSRDFILLAEGASADEIQSVKALRVFGNTVIARLVYGAQFAFATQRIDRSRLAQNRDWSLPAAQAATFKRDRALEAFTFSIGRANAEFRIINEGLLTHAPRSFPVRVSGADNLRIGFGMLPGSWSNTPATDGVCFRVMDNTGRTVLWERCLDPAKVEADRGLFHEIVALPPGTDTVHLVTDCREHCRLDWSYWSEVEPVRR